MVKLCVVIPVYNHPLAIGDMLEGVLAQQVDCFLVDDGSDAACAIVLDQLAAAHPQHVTLLRLAANQGKGAAVMTGCIAAFAAGYTHVLQIDADGQHRTAEIPRFAAISATYPNAVIAGCPKYDDSVPRLRLCARYLTHVWVWINTLSLAITDSMCGLRIYPLAPLMALHRRRSIGRRGIGRRMDFDTDVLVRLYWDGLQIINVPTRVTYPSDGVSHFRYLSDNLLITRMHVLHFPGMLSRLPRLIARHFQPRPPHTVPLPLAEYEAQAEHDNRTGELR